MADFPEDCLHLHACRRLTKNHKIKCRGCNKDCSAYESKNDFYIFETEQDIKDYCNENIYPESIYSEYELQRAQEEL